MENIMDIEQIQKVIEKTKLFFQEQDILLEEMGSILEELLDCFLFFLLFFFFFYQIKII